MCTSKMFDVVVSAKIIPSSLVIFAIVKWIIKV